MFQVMNSKVVIAWKTYQIMLVTFVITHEDILAMHTAVVMPPTLGFLNRFTLRMIIGGERYVKVCQIGQYGLLPIRYYVIMLHNSKYV